MAHSGMHYAGALEPDGKLHRFKAEGDHARNSWYVLHSGPPEAGAFGCWKRGISETWCARNGKEYSRDEWASIRRHWKEAERERKLTEAEAQAKARKTAAWVFAHAKPVEPTHPYLVRKAIGVQGELRQHGDALVLPLRDSAGTLHGLQFIGPDGSKRFLRGALVTGCFFLLGNKPDSPMAICEGYATGASVHRATGWPVVCAMNCGNLLAVAKAVRLKWPDREIIISADNDQFTAGNPGLRDAGEAAKAVKAFLAIPQFADEALADRPTDFNDLCRLAGLAEVRRQLQRANPTVGLLLDREFNPKVQPPPLRAIYTLARQCICTPGNLTAITAAIKSGKSAVVGALAAAAMPHADGADLLAFASSNPDGKALLWFDSEQSPDDFWHCVNRAVRRAGLQTPPPWLRAYCLTGLGFKRAWECATAAIHLGAEQHCGVHSVLLDGAADFVADVNDPEESNAFVATVHDLAIKHDCPVIGVIHFNPGGEKSRGHLGSQLERKAETNLSLEKDGNQISVIFLHEEPPRFHPQEAWTALCVVRRKANACIGRDRGIGEGPGRTRQTRRPGRIGLRATPFNDPDRPGIDRQKAAEGWRVHRLPKNGSNDLRGLHPEIRCRTLRLGR